jgi:uncharacterized phage protein (TIGR01671 family)
VVRKEEGGNMREIKFRGKRIDNGQWVYGYYLVAAGMPFISVFGKREPIPVIPDTVGQYTGLKDKKGKEIYEGDIIELERSGYIWRFVITFENEKYYGVFRDTIYRNFETDTVSDCGEATYKMVEVNVKRGTELYDFVYVEGADYTVIGNIHDNPELLESVRE